VVRLLRHHPRLHGFAGYATLRAERYDDARTELSTALGILSRSAVKQRAVFLADLATVELHQDDVDYACKIAADAARQLHQAGYATGDGAAGWAEHAPFDRILATCAITRIPPEWIQQLADGGRIVAPLDAADAGPLLVLDKIAPDEVTGHIDSYPGGSCPFASKPTAH
jgi:hypothetical protein